MRKIAFSLLFFIAVPAYAMVGPNVGLFHPVTFKISGIAGNSYLDSLLDSVVYDLDATIAASYPGTGQTWTNLAASPADGEAQTTYDFWLGADGAADGSDPAFTGAAGDAGAYFAMGTTGGVKYFKNKAGAITDFIKDAIKDAANGGVASTVGAVIYNVDTSSGAFWSNHIAGTSGHGFRVEKEVFENFRAVFSGAGQNSVVASSSTAIPLDSHALVMFSYDPATNTARFWMNSTTAVEVEVIPTTTDQDATSVPFLGVGVTDSLSTGMGDGMRYISAFMLNEYIDNTKAADIFAHFEARHGRDYTP